MLKELPDLLVSLVTVEETQKDSGDWRFSLRLSFQPASPRLEGLRTAVLLARQSSFCLNYRGAFYYLRCNLRVFRDAGTCAWLPDLIQSQPSRAVSRVLQCLPPRHKALDSNSSI